MIFFLKVVIYDLKLEMLVYELIDKVLDKLGEDKFDFIVLNFVNFDMVGYIGSIEVVIKVVEIVDICVGKLIDKIVELGGSVIIIVDYGNVEYMLDLEIGKIVMVYFINLVLFIVVG